MSGLSTSFKKGECREVVFWLLLFGSCQFLASPRSKTGIIGVVGAAAFPLYAHVTFCPRVSRMRGNSENISPWQFSLTLGLLGIETERQVTCF